MGLLNFLQSASNAAADTVAGPVDLFAFLLNKAGIPVQEPVGGSEWMKRRGLKKDVQQSAASLAGETVGLLSPVVAAAKAPQIAKGLLQAADNAAARQTLNPQAGAIVWHGSPHKFDKFDSSKIGTGEGAQAYGHGLYLAESPGVAQQYQRALSGRDLTEVGGRRVAELPISEDAKSFVQQVAANVQRGKSLDQAAEVLRKNIQLGHPNAQAMQEALSVLGSGLSRGNLYKVDLPDPVIARMLDWDKPLSQQAPGVRDALSRVSGAEYADKYFSANRKTQPTGADLHDFLRLTGMNPTSIAPAMKSAGIPGIRYLDGGSRGTGVGTSNFVVFPGEENILRILERNGQPLGLFGGP